MCKQRINQDGLTEAITIAHADISALNDARVISRDQLTAPLIAPGACLTERRNKAKQDGVLNRLLSAAKRLNW